MYDPKTNNRKCLDEYIPQFAQSLTKHPKVIESLLEDLYEMETLGFMEDGTAYNRHSGDKYLPDFLSLNAE